MKRKMRKGEMGEELRDREEEKVGRSKKAWDLYSDFF